MQTKCTLTIDIDAPYDAVMSELADAAQHPSWATEFFQGDATAISNTEVRVTVPRLGGPCRMKVEADNEQGIINIFIAPGDAPFGPPLPVRVQRNGPGAAVLWTLSQAPGMPDEAFAEGCASMDKELHALKAKLEEKA